MPTGHGELEPAVIGEILARAFPKLRPASWERTGQGVSTPVYRVERGREVYYVRLAEHAAASLAPEALVHTLLLARGVRVPEVVHFEERDPATGRSVMVTTEIPGQPIASASPDDDLRPIVVEAGRDLALINGVGVDGFGWIRRDRRDSQRLEAELPTHRQFVAEHLECLAELRTDGVLTKEEGEALERVLEQHDQLLDVSEAHLAHGDLDATHIYHEGGRYTGIIDFGEIRGADRLYDLGHFRAHDAESYPRPLLEHLLDGYRETGDLPADQAARIVLFSLLIAGRTLARHLSRGHRGRATDHLLAAIRRDMQELLQ